MKDEIIYWLKLILLTWPPILGYFYLYASTWLRVGLPFEWWVAPLLAALATLSEWLFMKWVGR